jgi:hypothetical protein
MPSFQRVAPIKLENLATLRWNPQDAYCDCVSDTFRVIYPEDFRVWRERGIERVQLPQ